MSEGTYQRLWAATQQTLGELLLQEPFPAEPEPERDRGSFFYKLASLFLHYLGMMRRLDVIYDQMVQPQKRRLVRRLLDGVVGRVLELKEELVQVDLSEYHCLDHVLQDLKLTPIELEIPIPKYFMLEQGKVLQDREALIEEIMERLGRRKRRTAVKILPPSEAIALIQRAERARQGRLRAKFMREIRKDAERDRRMRERKHEIDGNWAALIIQKIWRGFLRRRQIRQERMLEMKFIGMIPSSSEAEHSEIMNRAQSREELRRQRQQEKEMEYQEALVEIRQQVKVKEGPDIQEEMKKQIRQWFIECHDLTGRFPDYPDDEIGGSGVILSEKTPQQIKRELDIIDEENFRKKWGDKPLKEKKKEEEKPKKVEEDVQQKASKFVPILNEGHKEYHTRWASPNVQVFPDQDFNPDMIRVQEKKEVEAEIRIQVDKLMRQELQALRLVVDKEVTRPYKRRLKTKKGKKGKKKKKEKDLTPDRTLDSLYEELVAEGLIKKSEYVRLSDYIGDYLYLGSILKLGNMEPMPSLFDLRQNVILYGVLRLGSAEIHALAPHVRSILLAGPSGTGKKMLVNAVCTEAGANLFDLSPENIKGKYPGKAGLQLMMHMVFKVARLIQPSVIWIGNAEKTFYKKVPKDEKWMEPKRIKKDLAKAIRQLQPGDRIMLIGTTNQPQVAEVNGLCKTYQKILMVPPPDYASRYILWKHLIESYGKFIVNRLDLTALTKVSDGYTPGVITMAVHSVMTERRKIQLLSRPLKSREFLDFLAKKDPVYEEEKESLKNWYIKTPLGRQRFKTDEDQAIEEAARLAKEKKKKL